MGFLKDIQVDLNAEAMTLYKECHDSLLVEAVDLCKDAHAAEDLVMRTFEEFCKNREKYDPEKGSWLQWLKGIMRNIHHNASRGKSVSCMVYMSPEELALVQDSSENETGAIDAVLANSDAEIVRQAINGLSKEMREVILLKYFEDLPIAQIAKILKTSEDSIKCRLYYARKILAKRLGEKLGKKPVAIVVALLLSIATAFGAWKAADALGWLPTNEEPQVAETPTVDNAPETALVPVQTPATLQATDKTISATTSQMTASDNAAATPTDSKENERTAEMNPKTVKTMAVAATAAALATTASAETAIPASAYVQDGLVIQYDGFAEFMGNKLANLGLAGAAFDLMPVTSTKDKVADGWIRTETGWWMPSKATSPVAASAGYTVEYYGRQTGNGDGAATYFYAVGSSQSDPGVTANENAPFRIGSRGKDSKEMCIAATTSGWSNNANSLKPTGTLNSSVAATRTGTINAETKTIAYYENGVKISSAANTAGAVNEGIKRMNLGDLRPQRGCYWIGYLGSVRVYNRELTASEIALNSVVDKMRFEGAASGYRYNELSKKIEAFLEVAGGDGAMVSLDNESFAASTDGWFALGTSVTVYAKAPMGQSIGVWTGLPSDAKILDDKTTATFVLGAPMSVTAVSHTPLTLRWRGMKSVLASDASNWVKDDGSPTSLLPMNGDVIVLDATSGDLTWDLVGVRLSCWTQEVAYAGMVTFDTGLKTVEVSGDVSLQSGTWTHTANPSCTKDTDAWQSTRGTKQLIVACGGKFDLGANAMIDVTGCGYRAHQGPGSNVENGNQGGASGSYGGAGVVESSGWVSSRNIGLCYGSAKTPDSLGSGGNGSAGGGAVRIVVAEKLTLDGTIVADGADASGSYSGSGGSIYLTAGSIAGAGTLRAAGGDSKGVACGGGGRIALYVTDEGADYEEFTGTFDVSATVKGMAPFCGTVYREKNADNGRGELWIKGYNAPVSSIPEPMTLSCQTKGLYGTFVCDTDSTIEVGTLKMTGHARLHVPSNVVLSVTGFESENDGTWTNRVMLLGGKLSLAKDTVVTDLEIAPFWEPSDIVFDDDVTDKTLKIANGGRISPAIDMTLHGDLRILSGGSFSHYLGYPIALTVPGDCTIDEGGAIDVSGRGYVKDTGPGKSTIGQTGGSHGGRGNGGNPTGDNGPGSDGACYGSVTAPVTMGSGGRYGTGGGAIKLSVADTLTVNGAVNANGGYSDHYSGAGGSAWILTKRLLGSGPISANGGLVSKDGQCNGTGGGGRVAVWMTDPDYDFSEYTGAITAYGGSKPDGKIYGGAGTVYRKLATEAQNEGTLVIDNGLTSQYKNYECRIDPFVTDADVGTVIVTNNATFAITNNAAFTFRKQWIVSPNARFRGYPGSTVVCAPCGTTATMSGTNTFYNFTCEAPGKTLTFDAVGTCFGVSALGALTLLGDETAPLTLASTVDGSPWFVKADGAAVQKMKYLSVFDSDATAGALMVAENATGTRCSGWNFVNVTRGETLSWTGLSGTGWTDPGNWDGGRAPSPTDNLVVTNAANQPVLNADVTAWSITVAEGASLALNGFSVAVSNLTVNGTLAVQGKETLTVKKDAAFAANSFDAKRTTIVLEGSAAQTLTTGGNALYDVLVEKDGGSVVFADAVAAERLYVKAHGQLLLTFAAGEEVKAHEISFDGLVDGAAVLKLASSTPGTEWRLTAIDYAYATGVTVSDSNASGGHWFHAAQPSSGTDCTHWTFGETAYVWTGAANNEFSNPLNWAGNAVPDENARVRIDSAADIVVNAPVSVRELSLYGSNGAIGFTNNAPITVGESLVVGDNVVFECNTNVSVGGSVLVKAGGTITHVAAKTDLGQYVDIVAAGNMAVEEGGRIDVRGKGYTLGPGRTSSGSWYGPNHGGLGSGDTRDTEPAQCYDSIVDPRMGGSSGWTRGGGVVYIRVGGVLTVDGDIDARGVDRLTDGCYCGAGGTINLTASSLVGGGTLNASAGLDAKDRSGSGGRIAVHLTGVGASADDFGGKIFCFGGYGYQVGQIKHPGGSAGTIYVEDATSKGRGTVTIDNDGASASYAEKFGVQYPVPLAGDSPRVLEDATFVVTNGGSLMLTADCRIGDLDLKGSSSRLMLNGHVLQISTRHHRNQKGWTGKVVPGVDASGNPGKIVWLGGFMMFIR